MAVKIDRQNLSTIIACLWKNEKGEWEGILPPENLETTKKVKVLSSRRAIIVLDMDFIDGTDISAI